LANKTVNNAVGVKIKTEGEAMIRAFVTRFLPTGSFKSAAITSTSKIRMETGSRDLPIIERNKWTQIYAENMS
jgi:hypothetical protein